MHGGLPPSNTFPFTSFNCGLLPLDDEAGSKSPAAAGDAASAEQQQAVLMIDDPHVVAAAQQYNMQAQVRPQQPRLAALLEPTIHRWQLASGNLSNHLHQQQHDGTDLAGWHTPFACLHHQQHQHQQHQPFMSDYCLVTS
jgi:hypothetical protein